MVDELAASGIDGLLFTPPLDEQKADRSFLKWMAELPAPGRAG